MKLKLWSKGDGRERSRKCSTARNRNILEDAYSFLLSSYLAPRPLCSLVSPDRQGHGPNPKCRLFLKLTSKGTWRQVFVCLRHPNLLGFDWGGKAIL